MRSVTKRGKGVAALVLIVTATMGILVVRRACSHERRAAPAPQARTSSTASAAKTTDAFPSPPTYDAAVLQIRRSRELAEVLVSTSPDSWSRRASAAGHQLDYAQLTGDYEGYEAAQRSLTEAFEVAERRGGTGGKDVAVGPHLLHAQLSYTLHRFRAVLDDLRAPTAEAEFFKDSPLMAETKALRGAATFSLGEYDTGIALLREAVATEPTNPSHAQRLALALSKTGGADEASKLLTEVEAQIHTPRGKAWLELQRGLIDVQNGRRASARRHFEQARMLFPGWWLVDEHHAELNADEGRTAEAEAAYRSLIERTGDPEFMDALARLIAARAPEEARGLVERSRKIYEERLVRLPEASYGHALEHFLRMESDPQRAVEIAEKNRDLRPDGEARTRLAQAYVRAGRASDARAEMRRVLDSRWRNAESFATAALVFQLCGDRAAAAEAEARANATSPHALSELDWLHPLK